MIVFLHTLQAFVAKERIFLQKRGGVRGGESPPRGDAHAKPVPASYLLYPGARVVREEPFINGRRREMRMEKCAECGKLTRDYHYVRQRIQCRNCWDLSNMPSYLRVQTYLPQGKTSVCSEEE